GALTGVVARNSVALQNNSGNDLTLSGNGRFTFTTAVTYGGSYAVTVFTQPTGQTCSVTSGSGSNVTANVTNVAVSCTDNTYTIGGTLSGLGASKSVTLRNNGGNDLTLSGNGPFTFTTPVTYGGSYAVTVFIRPTRQTT